MSTNTRIDLDDAGAERFVGLLDDHLQELRRDLLVEHSRALQELRAELEKKRERGESAASSSLPAAATETTQEVGDLRAQRAVSFKLENVSSQEDPVGPDCKKVGAHGRPEKAVPRFGGEKWGGVSCSSSSSNDTAHERQTSPDTAHERQTSNDTVPSPRLLKSRIGANVSRERARSSPVDRKTTAVDKRARLSTDNRVYLANRARARTRSTRAATYGETLLDPRHALLEQQTNRRKLFTSSFTSFLAGDQDSPRNTEVLELAVLDQQGRLLTPDPSSIWSTDAPATQQGILEGHPLVFGAIGFVKVPRWHSTGYIAAFLLSLMIWCWVGYHEPFRPVAAHAQERQKLERYQALFDAANLVNTFSVVATLIGCHLHHPGEGVKLPGLLGTLELLNARPAKLDILAVSLLTLQNVLFFFWVITRSHTWTSNWQEFSRMFLCQIMTPMFWCSLGLARCGIQKIQDNLSEVYVNLLCTSDADAILRHYSKFHMQLLNIHPFFNKALAPYLVLSIMKLSFLATGVFFLVRDDQATEHVTLATAFLLREVVTLLWVAWPTVRTQSLHRKVEMAAACHASHLDADLEGVRLLGAITVGADHGGFKFGSSTLITWGFFFQFTSYGSILLTMGNYLVQDVGDL